MKNHSSSGSEVLQILGGEFARLLSSLNELTERTPEPLLYQHPPAVSVAEHILKSAAVLEQTFGGLTVNLWDDPFEWTLPETLSNSRRITAYLLEVGEARERAFSSFASDAALLKLVSVPVGEARPLLSVLLDALTRSADYRGHAVATLKILSGATSSGFII